MTPSISPRAKLQKKLRPSVKGSSEKFLDIVVTMQFLIDNRSAINENGVLSGTANSVIFVLKSQS